MTINRAALVTRAVQAPFIDDIKKSDLSTKAKRQNVTRARAFRRHLSVRFPREIRRRRRQIRFAIAHGAMKNSNESATMHENIKHSACNNRRDN